jgi:hypothetical protein
MISFHRLLHSGGVYARWRQGRRQTQVALVKRSSAPPIDQHGICRPLCLFVDEQYARALGSEVPVAPDEHRHDDRTKIAALVGQNIFVASRPLAVAAPFQETGIDQCAQAARQHVGRDLQALLEFVEAREPVRKRMQTTGRRSLAGWAFKPVKLASLFQLFHRPP